MIALDEDTMLGTYAEIARVLGATTNQVYMWHQRAAGNGFPKPVGYYATKFHHHPVPHFDIDEVRAWRIFYIPPTRRPWSIPAQRDRSEQV